MNLKISSIFSVFWRTRCADEGRFGRPLPIFSYKSRRRQGCRKSLPHISVPEAIRQTFHTLASDCDRQRTCALVSLPQSFCMLPEQSNVCSLVQLLQRLRGQPSAHQRLRTLISVLQCICLLTVLWAAPGRMSVLAAESAVPEELQSLYAQSAALMDGDSGRVLFGKNETDILPMASTTKIMTCILALELGNPEDTVTVSANAAAQPEVKLGASAGEQFRLEDLLYAMMLESYNDAAVMIAEHIGGSVEMFADRMNEKAQELGCTDTHFVTPNGLDASDEEGSHSTTAQDLGRIMKYCAWDSSASEEFLEITQTRNYQFDNLEGTGSYSCSNHNAFLDMEEDAISGKTGFTSAAGYCYVCAVESEGRRFTGVVLACGWPYNRTYKWKDMTKLIDYAKAHYHLTSLETAYDAGSIEVENGLADNRNPWERATVGLYADPETPLPETVLLGDGEEITRRTTLKKTLQAPVAAGTVAGCICYELEGEELFRILLRTEKDMPVRTLKHWFLWTLQNYTLQL